MQALNHVEARIVGALAEKELATPQQYPLTLNALVLACNQSSNRDPVLTFDDATVLGALDALKTGGLVRFVHPSHGRSAIRYRLVLREALSIDTAAQALLSVLLLRGPQTPGELRTRTERLAELDDLAQLEAVLGALAQREGPLVQRIGRQPGQKEDRFVQLLIPEAERAQGPRRAAPGATATHIAAPAPAPVVTPTPPAIPPTTSDAAPDSTLERKVAELGAEVARLRSEVEELRGALGG